MIKINNVHKSFNGVEVLKDITLEIKKGEVFGLVGHSGAGKSTLLRCINGLETYDKGSILVNEYEEVKEFHQKVREQINSQKENVFTTPAEELQREAAVIYPLLEEYMALTKRFAEIYFLCKKEKNVYDFDDLEHFALELVESYDKQGEAQPSETAKELSKKYKMIFVDEYQDTNLVQETILEMLLNKKHNSLFTVGDVKQSIYRFRQARPDLFLRRKDQG